MVMQIKTLEAVFDEIEKIGASYRTAGYMQMRKGTRPIRAHNLVNRDQITQDPEIERPAEPEAISGEEDESDTSVGKTASERKWKERKEQAIGTFAKARPYVVGGIKGAVPGALIGNVMSGGKMAKTLGVAGATLGVTNEFLKDWAEKNKRKAVAKEILGK